MTGESKKRIRGTSREIDRAARRLRREHTPAESVLWEAIRGRQLGGAKFRRQHPFERFVLDLYCAEARLCIEVDGSVHDEQQERDAARTAVLDAGGIRVLRFRNEEVLTQLPTVLSRIAHALQSGTT